MAWQFVPAVLTTIGAISSYSSGQQQNKNRLAWGQYNAQMQYNTAMGNIDAQVMLAGLNFGFAKQAAGMQSKIAEFQYGLASRAADMELYKAQYNANILTQTTLYNNSLLDAEIADIWEAADLDLVHLANQRARERGAMSVDTGVTLGQDSHAEVMIDSMTQEALDAFVVRRGADRKVRDINNQIAKNLYEGQLGIHKMAWEGKLNHYNIMLGAQANYMNAQMGAASTLLQGAADYASANISAIANRASAYSQLQSNLYGAQFDYDANKAQLKNNLTRGIFSGIGMGIGTYYDMKQPASTYNFVTQMTPATVTSSSLKTSGSQPVTTPYKFGTGYEGTYSLAREGTSLFGY